MNPEPPFHGTTSVYHSRAARAGVALSASMLLTSLAGVIITPTLLPALLALPIVAPAVPPLDLAHADRRRLFAAAWSTAALVAILGVYPPQPHPAPVPPLTATAVLLLTTTAVTALLWQRLGQLLTRLEQADAANRELARARDALEAEVETRTAELREREERHRAISELTSDYVYSLHINADGQPELEWITDSFERVTGYASDVLRGEDSWLAPFHPDDRPLAMRHFEQALSGASDVCDLRLKLPDGSVRWLRLYARPLAEPGQQQVTRILGAGQDITAEKEAQQNVRLFSEQRRSMLDLGHTLLALRTMDDLLREVEHMLARILRYDTFSIFWLDEAAGVLRASPPVSSSPHAGEDSFTLPLGVGIAGAVAQTGHGELVNNAQRDPRSVYLGDPPEHDHLICLPIEAENGPRGVFTVSRAAEPFTPAEYESAELFVSYLALAIQNTRRFEQLQTSEARYRSLFEELPDAAYVSTPDGRFLDVNPACVELFGAESREELLATELKTLCVDSAEHARFQQLLAEHGALRNVEMQVMRKDGQLRTVLGSVTADRNASGEIVAWRGFLRDITEQRRAQEQLQHVLTGIQCLMWYAIVQQRGVANPDENLLPLYPGLHVHRSDDISGEFHWRIQILNEEIASQFLPVERRPGESYTTALMASRLPEETEAMDRRSHAALLAGLPGYSQEIRCRRADGEIRWLHEDARIEKLGPGCWRLVGICFDVTERRREREQLDFALSSARCLLWHATVEEQEGQLVWDLRIAAEDAAQKLLPLEVKPGQSYNDAWRESKLPEDQSEMNERAERAIREGAPGYSQEFRCTTIDGEIRWLREDVRIERTGPKRWRLVGVCTDVTELKRAEEALRHQVIRDPLTGLFNRRYMEESLERELHRAARQGEQLGIMMLDLDHFKQFNDLHGHLAGDAMLRSLGAFLQSHVRAEDIVCRYGGEEFTLILPSSSLEDTRRRAEQLRVHARDIVVEYRSTLLEGVTLSIGVAAYPDHGSSVDELLLEADRALYLAKSAGRNQVAVAPASAVRRQSPQLASG